MTFSLRDFKPGLPQARRVVSRFEASLLRILYCFLQRAPLEQALPRGSRGGGA